MCLPYRVMKSIEDHYYTTSTINVTKALSQGYAYDGAGGAEIVEGYCVPEMACGATLPLYSFYSASSTGIFINFSAVHIYCTRSPACILRRLTRL